MLKLLSPNKTEQWQNRTPLNKRLTMFFLLFIDFSSMFSLVIIYTLYLGMLSLFCRSLTIQYIFYTYTKNIILRVYSTYPTNFNKGFLNKFGVVNMLVVLLYDCFFYDNFFFKVFFYHTWPLIRRLRFATNHMVRAW